MRIKYLLIIMVLALTSAAANAEGMPHYIYKFTIEISGNKKFTGYSYVLEALIVKDSMENADFLLKIFAIYYVY